MRFINACLDLRGPKMLQVGDDNINLNSVDDKQIINVTKRYIRGLQCEIVRDFKLSVLVDEDGWIITYHWKFGTPPKEVKIQRRDLEYDSFFHLHIPDRVCAIHNALIA